MILDSSKKETPCFHRPVSIQIDSSLPQRFPQPVSRGSDVALHNKSPPKTHILPVLPVILDSSKKETPCFHRPVSIQIDSPLPQGVTQSVLRTIWCCIHNKSPPKLIFYLFCLRFWIGLKRKRPVSTDQFQFRLTVHCPSVSLNQFQEDLMLIT